MKALSILLCFIALEVKSNDVVSEANGKDLLLRWNKCHNDRDPNCFASLFSSNALFYSKTLTTTNIINLKASLFDKHPNFSQVINDNTVSYYRYGDTLAIHFVKEVETVSGKKKYPSYLLILKDRDSDKIVAESDDITDKKLGLSREWDGTQPNINSDSVVTTNIESKSATSKRVKTSNKPVNINTPNEPTEEAHISTLEFTWKRFFICSIPFFITVSMFLRKIIGIKPEDSELETGLSFTQKFIWGTALLAGLMLMIGSVFIDYIMAFSAIAAIQYLILFHGYSNKCNECSEWWAAKLVNKEVVERWQEMKNVRRIDITKDRNGREVSRRNRTEQLVVDCQKIRSDYQCKKCGNRWATTATKKSDTMWNDVYRQFGGR